MKLPIYLDYAATTPVDSRVADTMMRHLTVDGVFGNPASRSHSFGWQAESAVEEGRRQVAALLRVDPREVVWTSGATESNNLALKGYAKANCVRGRHIVTSAIEHKSVLDTCAQLEREGFEVTYLLPGVDGAISPQTVADALRADTALVSIMHVNNETGVINDIASIGKLCREKSIVFHVDAAQSVGKVPVMPESMNVDLMSFSGHKLYGPKGIGALYVRRKSQLRIEAQMHGGGHERGLRAGTLPVHQIVGMAEAFRLAAEEMPEETSRLLAYRERLWQCLSELGGVQLNGAGADRVPGILNVSFTDIEGESLMIALKDLAVSRGSACTSAREEPSHVLRALGLDDNHARSSIRFSFGRNTTEAEVDFAINLVRRVLPELRSVHSPAAARL